MSTTSTSRRPRPLRSLHLVSNSISIPSSPLSATTDGLKSAASNGSTQEGQAASPISRNNMPRRQSSISYNTGSSKPRSPGLVRSNSTDKATESNVISIRRVDENCSPRASSLPVVQESEPVTLAEKHADLLRFIAQKESKCLELRTQLAQHEADLLLLKRKWERIVSKGLPSSSRSDPSISAAVDMLGDIREGVQNGLGKVFAVLEPNAFSTPSQSSTSEDASPISAPVISSPSSSKRTSISTSSSVSTRCRSSISNSRSSASSLFDDIPPANPKSLDLPSNYEDESACLSTGAEASPSDTSLSRASSPIVQSPTLSEADDASGKNRRSRPLSMSLSQFTPILPTVETLTPISKQMANWVPPGLNKRWEELKGNETLSKQSKRATLLFNDMLAVLAPPATGSPQTSTSSGNDRSSSTLMDISSSNAVILSNGAFGSKASLSPSPSLLDDDSDFGSGVVMQPDVKSVSDWKPQGDNANADGESEEEWNW